MTYRKTCSAAALLTAFLMVLPQPASAQQAHSFEQLQLLVKPGDRIFVTGADLKVTEGRVVGLSRSTLSLRTKTTNTDLAESDVMQIRQWRHDSLKNGAIIGTGVGLGIGALAAVHWCHEWSSCGSGEGLAVAAFWGGVGAGLGIGIDALIPTK